MGQYSIEAPRYQRNAFSATRLFGRRAVIVDGVRVGGSCLARDGRGWKYLFAGVPIMGIDMACIWPRLGVIDNGDCGMVPSRNKDQAMKVYDTLTGVSIDAGAIQINLDPACYAELIKHCLHHHMHNGTKDDRKAMIELCQQYADAFATA